MKKFSIISLLHVFNGFTPTALMVLIFLSGYNSDAAEIGIISSLTLVILQIFSSNKRNIIISTRNIYLLISTLYFRFFFIIILIGLYFLITKKFSTLNFSIFFLCLSLWINEIYLTYLEIKKKFLKTYLCFGIFYFILSIFFLTQNNLDYIYFLTIIYSFFLLLIFFIINFFKIDFLKLFSSKINIINSFKENIISISFASSFFFVLSVLVWRVSLVQYVGIESAAIYFVCFALCSFPATLFNNYIGITFIKNNYEINSSLILFISAIVIIPLLLFFTLSSLEAYSFPFIDINNFELLISILIFSTLGSFVMIYSMYMRIKILSYSKKYRKVLFKIDIFYGITMSTIVPILGSINIEYLIYSYLIGGIVSIIFFKSLPSIVYRLKHEND